MMDYTSIGITDKKAQQFIKAGLPAVEDLAHYWPRKYTDRRVITGILPKEQESVFIMRVNYVNRRYYAKTVVDVTGYLNGVEEVIKIVWFNQDYIYNVVKSLVGQEVLVCGNVEFIEANGSYPAQYQVVAPTVFTRYDKKQLKIYPTYRKIKGMSEEYLEKSISQAVTACMPMKDSIPESIMTRFDLIPYEKMALELHWPTSPEKLEAAQRRKRWEDLLYFALRVELNKRYTAAGSSFSLPTLRTMRKIQNSLPFELTEDQAKALDESIESIRTGRRLNALIQGDVGCGKTIVAVLLMTAFAENGYQAILMAPTQLLAKQHYEYLKSLVEQYGLSVAFVSGAKMRAKEQAALENDLREGKYQLIVGTQALLSNNYQFKNLALIIEDEEHKYGVLQRKKLVDKAAQGTHTVKMSATPIPRTLAQIVYGDDLQLFCIRTKPSGRKPVKTGIARSMDAVYDFILKEVLYYGHQVYVVCPRISSNKKMDGVTSAEEVFEQYRNTLGQYGVTVGLVTGKTKKTEAEEIFRKFDANDLSVLISTTVIEVGINVPNSSTIIIHNAERFGLAQLHQLRGRVGRGKARGVCVLVSEERENERLKALCTYTDGFKIAEMDLGQRGAGDLIGCQQSGSEYYLSLALMYPDEYEQAKEAAAIMLDSSEESTLFDRAYEDFLKFGDE